jgi:hypothetical protein
MRELAPDGSVSSLREHWPLRDQDILIMLLDGLRIVGLPEKFCSKKAVFTPTANHFFILLFQYLTNEQRTSSFIKAFD